MNRILLAVCMLVAVVGVAGGQPNDAGVPVVPRPFDKALLDFSDSDAFDGTEATMSPRFYRSGIPGDSCSTFLSGDFQYRTYPFWTDGSGQLTLTFSPGDCATNIYVTLHAGSFNPASICDNYVWAYGSSVDFSETVAVSPNTYMLMVVSAVAAAPNVSCGPYSFSLTGADPIPTVGQWGLLALFTGLALTGLFVVFCRFRSGI